MVVSWDLMGFTRPGKRLHNYGQSPFYSWENQL